jgi:hypothetical protein
MAATTIGTQNLTWGLTAESYGVVQSFSETRNIEKSEVKNNAGETTALAFYNPTTAYSLSVAVTGSPTITAGGALTALANASGSLGTCRVDSITLNKSNTSFVTMDISATGYPNVS